MLVGGHVGAGRMAAASAAEAAATNVRIEREHAQRVDETHAVCEPFVSYRKMLVKTQMIELTRMVQIWLRLPVDVSEHISWNARQEWRRDAYETGKRPKCVVITYYHYYYH